MEKDSGVVHNRKHQSPVRTILSHINCFIQGEGEAIGFQVLPDSLVVWQRPGGLLQGSMKKAVTIFLASVLSDIWVICGWSCLDSSCAVVCLTSSFHTRCQLLCHSAPTVQYPTISSDVSIPYTWCLVTAWRRQCYAGGLTTVCSQCSTLLRDPSPVYDAPTTSPTHSPVSTGWRPRSMFSSSWRQSSIVHWMVRLLITWLQIWGPIYKEYYATLMTVQNLRRTYELRVINKKS